jgi:hypothetical protein
MTLSFNAIILLLLVAYSIWMFWAERRNEQASTDGLSDTQKQRFAEAYSFGRPNDEYPEDLRTHAATVQKARIRKGTAVIIWVIVPIVVLFRGI